MGTVKQFYDACVRYGITHLWVGYKDNPFQGFAYVTDEKGNNVKHYRLTIEQRLLVLQALEKQQGLFYQELQDPIEEGGIPIQHVADLRNKGFSSGFIKVYVK